MLVGRDARNEKQTRGNGLLCLSFVLHFCMSLGFQGLAGAFQGCQGLVGGHLRGYGGSVHGSWGVLIGTVQL